jgi:hypothetical protein
MRALEITGYGGPERIQITENAPQPAAPGAGQVLVRVAAARVNQVDTKYGLDICRHSCRLNFRQFWAMSSPGPWLRWEKAWRGWSRAMKFIHRSGGRLRGFRTA